MPTRGLFKASWAKSFARCFVIVLFLAVTAGTGLIDSLMPLPMPKLVGREKTTEEQLRRRARIADGSKARLLERHQRMQSRVRQTATAEYGFALYRWLHEVRPTVVFGRGGWLFLRSRAYPRRVMDDSRLSLLASQIAVISQRISDLGSQLVVVPVPRKAVLCADRLPSWCDSQAGVDSAFIAQLKDRGVMCVDLLQALRSSSASPYYYMRGSHWTHDSRIVAAEEICRVAGILASEPDRTTRIVSLGQRPEDYDVLKCAGIEPNQRIKHHLARVTSTRYRVVAGSLETRAHPKRGSRTILFGSSFSNSPLPDLIHHYSGIPVERHARPGVIALDVFASYLRRTGAHLTANSLPQTVIVELPIHSLFDGLEGGVSLLIGLLRPSPAAPVATNARIDIPSDLHYGRAIPQHRVPVISVPLGIVTPTSTGSVGVRLAGTVTGHDLVIDVGKGFGAHAVRWSTGQESIVIPLMDAKPSPVTRVFARAAHQGGQRAHLKLDEAEFVAYGEALIDVVATTESPLRGSQGWYQTIRFDGSPAPAKRGLLEIALSMDVAFDGRVSVEVPDGEKDQTEITFESLRRNATIFLDIKPSLPLTLSLRGSGDPPPPEYA